MIIRLSVLVRYTKRTKSLISDLKMGALMVTLERSSHPGDSRVLLLINNEIIQMRNGASEYIGPSIQKLSADVADVGPSCL